MVGLKAKELKKNNNIVLKTNKEGEEMFISPSSGSEILVQMKKLKKYRRHGKIGWIYEDAKKAK